MEEKITMGEDFEINTDIPGHLFDAESDSGVFYPRILWDNAH